MAESDPVELKETRFALFHRSIELSTPRAFIELQADIADEIRRSEKLLGIQADPEPIRFHIDRLRLYCDGLAWATLHPHVIRQLAKNDSTPKMLVSQGKAFDEVIESAKDYAKRLEAPVIVADLTSVIRIGDLVLVTDPESPQLVELKTRFRPSLLMRGRVGRQISRALGTMRYLTRGTAKVHGDELQRVVVESDYKASRNWDAIETVSKNAIKIGYARLDVSEHEVLWAFRKSSEETFKSNLASEQSRISTCFFGTTLGLMARKDELFPTPAIWQVSEEVRFAVLEEEIIVAHMLETSAFKFATDAAAVEFEDGTDDFPLIVTVGGKRYPFSLRFVYDVLYGYETTDSAVQGAINFAWQLHQMPAPEVEESPVSKPYMHQISSRADVSDVVGQQTIPDTDLCAVHPEVMAELVASQASDPGLWPGRRADDRGTFAIMSVGDLRKLVRE